MSLSRWLYRAARIARTTEAAERSIETQNPEYIERRMVNIAKGRALARLGFWLWGGGRRGR